MRAWSTAEPDLASRGACLLFAGPGANSNTVKKWQSGLRWPENVFVMGRVQPADVAAYLRSCDVVLIPSMEEGLPNLAMEAAACGRAVLGSNVGGIPEAVRHEATGLILPAGDTAAWSHALTRASADLNWLARLGSAGRRLMEAEFDSSSFAPRMHALYSRARACVSTTAGGVTR